MVAAKFLAFGAIWLGRMLNLAEVIAITFCASENRRID
jgi:hypothetical protein